jgi:fumarate reductase flavoprotein subunit
MQRIDAYVVTIGAGVIKADDSHEQQFNDSVGGGDWLCDQDAVDFFVSWAAEEMSTMPREHGYVEWLRSASLPA